MQLNKKLLRQIIKEEMENAMSGEKQGEFGDRGTKVKDLRNAIIRHLKENGGHITRRAAMESDPSFDNMVAKIVDMAEWDE